VADSAQFKTNPARAPLLVLGVDGATWRVIQPVIDRGGAPTLARLSAAGVRGRVDAQWPPQYWSAPAWSAILTGHDRATTGVHEDLSVQAAGLPLFQLPLGFEPLLNAPLFVEAVLMYYDVIEPMPTPRAQLAVPPIWERLALGGDRVAVVGMPFTYPATGPATWVVSDRVGIDLWRLMSVAPGERNRATYPAGETNRLMAWFEPNAAAQAPILATLFPQLDWPMPGDTFVHPIDVLRQVVRDTEGMFGAGEWIVRADPAVNLLMVYVGSFDNVAHAFWQYRFPDEFPDAPPDPGDVAVLGPVMDRYVEYLDQHVGRLIASFPRPPNVLLVSDHGEARTADRFGWKGVHARDGLFLAAGPDVLTRPEWIDVSYYDVAPTMVTLRGARPPADLTGRVLVGEPAPVR
jgi:predicted AlkP superfamily phosphohydrolase/phosphomutase